MPFKGYNNSIREMLEETFEEEGERKLKYPKLLKKKLKRDFQEIGEIVREGR